LSVPRLKRSRPNGPGIARRARGRGFTYVDVNGTTLTDAPTLERIKALVIPPAWRDVWICPYPNGHIQAIGVDAAGRRQYLYHPDWRTRRDAIKHDHVTDVARLLPAARARIAEDLASRGLNKRRVLAAAARMLDLGFFRIGGERYAEENSSYGLATIRREHVTLERGGVVTFAYPAKSGRQRVQALAEPGVVAVIRALLKRPGGGEELLAYRDGGVWRDVRSSDINDYLCEVVGTEVSAKDFRTWHGTVLAAIALAVAQPEGMSPTARKRLVTHAVKEVSTYLGNTPAVCRRSYIDPRVIERFEAGETIERAVPLLGVGTEEGQLASMGGAERAVLRLLTD
jgi:DNA topoisomerase-1